MCVSFKKVKPGISFCSSLSWSFKRILLLHFQQWSSGQLNLRVILFLSGDDPREYYDYRSKHGESTYFGIWRSAIKDCCVSWCLGKSNVQMGVLHFSASWSRLNSLRHETNQSVGSPGAPRQTMIFFLAFVYRHKDSFYWLPGKRESIKWLNLEVFLNQFC